MMIRYRPRIFGKGRMLVLPPAHVGSAKSGGYAVDIVDKLRVLASMVDDRPTAEIEEALLEAADAIETLRAMVAERRYRSLKDVDPEGNA